MTQDRDDFQQQITQLDRQRLKRHLLSLNEPCYESELMRLVFPDLDILRMSPLSLYRHHFLLFHLLYRLQDEFYPEGKYLFIHCMRTCLAAYPPAGQCRHYDPPTGQFCGAAVVTEKMYCRFHLRQVGETALETLSEKFFYLDPENYYSLDEETARAFISGAWELLSRYDAYQESLAVLGVSATTDITGVKRRFRHLAKQYHPDKGAASADRFYEINRAYRLLLRILPPSR